MPSKRVCQIISIKPERLEEYIEVHKKVWPGVLKALKKANFKNYTINHSPLHSLLIAHFTYIGSNWEEDMNLVAEDEETKRWWKLTDGMQVSLVEGAEGSGGKKGWWLDLKEVFWFAGEGEEGEGEGEGEEEKKEGKSEV